MPPPQPFTTCDADFVATRPLRDAEQQNMPGMPGPTRAQVAATEAWFAGAPVPHTVGNAVVAYIYGTCAFADIADAMATAKAPEHRIYILGWLCDPFARLKPGGAGGFLADFLFSTKAQVRCMFWDDPGTSGALGGIQPINADNRPMMDVLKDKPNAVGILDHKLPFIRFGGQATGARGGVHHQKLVVVSGSAGLIAFTGGMDLVNNRIDVDGGDLPWHDVHVRVIGPAAKSLLRVFRQRWQDHPDTAGLDRAKFHMEPYQVDQDFDRVEKDPTTTPDLPTATRKAGARNDAFHAVAIGRTYADLAKFNSGANKETYSFASSGEETAWALIQAGVQRAKSFIYIEDQYFMSRRMRDELKKKLQDPKFQFLLVLTTRTKHFDDKASLRDNPEVPYLAAMRNEIRADLLAVDPDKKKWRMFSLNPSSDTQRQQWCGGYVHAKIMICDDDYAIVGSANVDDRGYSYDTEVVAAITDDAFGRSGAQRFARNLRLNLWHKHLGVPQRALVDWKTGLRSWIRPPPQAMVVDASAFENTPLIAQTNPILRDCDSAPSSPDSLWRQIIDPDADLIK